MTFLSETIYGGTGYGGFGGWGMPVVQDAATSPDPAEKARPGEPLERPYAYGGYTYFPGFDEAPPLTLDLLWQIRRFSAITLAYQCLAGPILAGSRTLEIRKGSGDTATAADRKPGLTGVGIETKEAPEDKIKAACEAAINPLWSDILTGTECFNFGYWVQQVVFERRDGIVVPTRFIDFDLDEVLGQRVQLQQKNRQFAGIKYDGQERAAPYVLHNVCNSHLNSLTGFARAAFAVESWWRIKQTKLTGDRLMKKPTGCSVLIHAPMGASFVDPETKEPLVSKAAIQAVFNALSSNGAAVVPSTPFKRSEFINNPALLDKPAIRVDQFAWPSTAADVEACTARVDAETKELVRAYGLPERALTEATLAGSRADATAHGEQADDASEQEHGNLLRQFNAQTFNTTLVTNWGPRYRDRLFWKPGQTNAADKAAKQQLFATLAAATQPQVVDMVALANEVEVKTVVGWTPQAPQPEGQSGERPANPDGGPDDADPSAGLTDRERKIADEIAA